MKLPGDLSTKSLCPAVVPQGSVISLLLFNIFIDDIDDAIPANLHDRVRVCKYADDCTFYESTSTIDQSSMQVVLNSIHEWTTSNHMLINSKKTKDMLLTFRKSPTTPDSLYLGNCQLERVNVTVFELLRAWFQDDLRWNHHIEEMTKKANRRLFLLRECRKANLPKDVGITLYNTKIRPLLQYASPVWEGLPICLKKSNQFKTVALVLLAYQELLALHERRSTAIKRELGKILKDESNPNNVFVKSAPKNQYNLTSRRSPYIEVSGIDRHQCSFIP